MQKTKGKIYAKNNTESGSIQTERAFTMLSVPRDNQTAKLCDIDCVI